MPQTPLRVIRSEPLPQSATAPVPPIGADVTSLISPPPIGSDVTSLMTPPSTGQASGPVRVVQSEPLPDGPGTFEEDLARLRAQQSSGDDFAGDLARLRAGQGLPPDRPRHPHALVGEFAVGAAKSVGRTALSVLDVLNWLSSQVSPAARADFEGIRAQLEADSATERAGGVAGDLATSVLPAGAVARGARLAASHLPRMAAPIVRGAIEGGAAATIASAQGNDPRLAGLVGAAGPLISLPAGRLAQSADDQMVRALGPSGRSGPSRRPDLLTARDRAPELLDRGFVAMTQGGALDKAQEALTAAAQQLDEAWKAIPAGSRMRTGPMVQIIERLKNRMKVQGASGSIVPSSRQTEFALLTRLQEEIQSLGPIVAPDQMRKLRQAWDSAVNWDAAMTASDRVTSQVYRTGADLLRKQIARAHPAVADANREFALWRDIQGILTRATERPAGGVTLRSQIAGGTAGGAAGFALGDLSGAAIGAFVAQQLSRAMGSPGWRYVSANARHALADAMESGKTDAIMTALGPVMAEAFSAANPGTPSTAPGGQR